MAAGRARSLRLCLLLAAAALVALFTASRPYGVSAPSPAMSLAAAQQKVADLILWSFGLVVEAVLSVLPGAMLALISYQVYTKRDQLTRRQWATLTIMLVCSLVIWAGHVRWNAAPAGGGAGVRGQALAVGPVHSGEAVCTKDGRFISLPDPSKEEGDPIEPNWQRALASAMTEAIRMGREQVVLVFSRQGCPWCERQVPVLQRAIQNRAREIQENAAVMPAPSLAFVGGGGSVGTGMLLAPLRVFVLDAGEFPYLAQQFRIEAFPTSMFFGMPGATPLVAQGYLNDEQIEEILRAAALAQPPSANGGRQKRRGWFR